MVKVRVFVRVVVRARVLSTYTCLPTECSAVRILPVTSGSYMYGIPQIGSRTGTRDEYICLFGSL